MSQVKTINEYQKCKWEVYTQNHSGNSSDLGYTNKILANRERYASIGPVYVWKAISNLQNLSDSVDQRLARLIKIRGEEYIIPINAYGTKQKTNQVFVVTNKFISAISLARFIQSQNEINGLSSKIAQIFHQIAKALSISYKKYSVPHLRLCPSCIVLKIPRDKLKGTIMVRLSDYGIGPEQKNKTNYQYWHPKFIDQDINPYSVNIAQAFKFDMWSYGIMLYETLFGSRPNKMNQKNYKKIITKKLQSCPNSFLNRIILKCLEIQQPFTDWDQIVSAIDQNYEVVNTQNYPVTQLFMNHIRLMFLFSQIYITIRQKIKEYELDYGDNNMWTLQDRMEKLSVLLIVFGSKYHDSEFQTYFGSRCYLLGPEAVFALQAISDAFLKEIHYLKSSFVMKKIKQIENKDVSIENIFDDYIDTLAVFCKMIGEAEKQKDRKLRIICEFWTELFKCCKSGQSILQENGRQMYITTLSSSPKFRTLAQREFGFDYREYMKEFNIQD